jgi:hypothetical protein
MSDGVFTTGTAPLLPRPAGERARRDAVTNGLNDATADARRFASEVERARRTFERASGELYARAPDVSQASVDVALERLEAAERRLRTAEAAVAYLDPRSGRRPSSAG